MAQRKNINRGYMKLIVWQDAKALIESLQEKQQAGGWCDSFVVRESNTAYTTADEA